MHLLTLFSIFLLNFSPGLFNPDFDPDQCFCKLQGAIDDCTCSVDTVDYFNNAKIYPRLKSLLVKDYFRFFKVNLKKSCPFWEDDGRCAMKHCTVKACSQNEIPAGLKGDFNRLEHRGEPMHVKYTQQAQEGGCDSELDELGYLNTTISADAYKEFELWQAHDDVQDNFCTLPDDDGEAEYVDLLLNPERYTGYKGLSANRIWRSIYLENCFRPKDETYRGFMKASNLNGLCLEKRAFYRAVSGLHASINIHLCSMYLFQGTVDFGGLSALKGAEGYWGPNLNEFKARFSPETTNGEGPQWLKNLYFVYLLELRAIDKASTYLQKELYYTGNDDEDKDTRAAINDLLSVIKTFPNHFNESSMFNGGSQALKLKEEFRQHFHNISQIMDCVGCEKCKLWGKLQTQGLGTALKILFSSKFDKVNERGLAQPSLNRRFRLERSEIVALFNAIGRLSTSIHALETFREMMR